MADYFPQLNQYHDTKSRVISLPQSDSINCWEYHSRIVMGSQTAPLSRTVEESGELVGKITRGWLFCWWPYQGPIITSTVESCPGLQQNKLNICGVPAAEFLCNCTHNFILTADPDRGFLPWSSSWTTEPATKWISCHQPGCLDCGHIPRAMEYQSFPSVYAVGPWNMLLSMESNLKLLPDNRAIYFVLRRTTQHTTRPPDQPTQNSECRINSKVSDKCPSDHCAWIICDSWSTGVINIRNANRVSGGESNDWTDTGWSGIAKSLSNWLLLGIIFDVAITWSVVIGNRALIQIII